MVVVKETIENDPQGITTTLSYPSQNRAKKIRRRQILILSYKAISRNSRRRDEKEPMGSSTVVYGKRGCKVRDETRPRENF
jgi:hypothetical protein